jgi:hypothetical protein
MDRDTCFDIQDDIAQGELTFAQIAVKYGVHREDVELLADEMNDYDDSMDGDFDSAMASAGYGMDEDYVCDNDYFDDF